MNMNEKNWLYTLNLIILNYAISYPVLFSKESWNEPRENQSSQFQTRFDSNQSLQSQKQARSMNFWIQVEEELYYLCSEIRAVAGQRSSPDLRFATKSIKVYES